MEKSLKTPEKVIDFNSVSKKWSPEDARIERSNADGYKVRSIQGGHVGLRGGDYITNKLGQGVTVSFCFFNNGKKYGLTVAHIFQRVGDIVFAHSTDRRGPNGKYVIAEIGKIVALHWNTDSAIFEIRGWVEIEALYLAAQSGLAGPLKITDLDTVPPLQIGTRLVGFGAQRRGAVAVVSQFWDNSTGGQQLPVLDGDIFLASASDGGKPASDDGDCGTIFIDENSHPRYFHHCIAETYDTPPSYRSAGVPFEYILKAHPIILGGDVSVAGPLAASHQSALLQPPNFAIKDASPLAGKQGSSVDSKFSVPAIKNFAASQPSKLFDVVIVARNLGSSDFCQIVAGAAQFEVEFVDLDPAKRAST